ncbi:MAG: alpha/beta hydrolase [Neomegalonema sp.]|nr:alpha/beta hydrolase [Neomegalonema sp.]
MSLRLRLLNAYMRSFVKPRLARASSAEALRRGLRRGSGLLPAPPNAAEFDTAHLTFPNRAQLRLRWCRFVDGADQPPSPVKQAVLYLHGGAYIAGSPETHQSVIWPLARAARAPIAALDYRLAPENPFPAAFDDTIAAFDALAAQLGPDSRIALAGDSAGGGLALAAAAVLCARGSGPKPVAVTVFSPFVDLALKGRSLTRNARREAMLPPNRFADAITAYLAGADPRDPRASPLYASWRSPPPTLIQASHIEALRDDAIRIADTLRRAGGDVRLEMWRRTPHAWQFFAPWVAESAEAVASAGRFLAGRLAADPASQAA